MTRVLRRHCTVIVFAHTRGGLREGAGEPSEGYAKGGGRVRAPSFGQPRRFRAASFG
ncbi:hypothetical protein [Streptomyces sp. CA-132043]|uniref:hypothetical protein n=1 Tax=Streptomyces sp. CA-132043 TaxID=3240048 RepID=UPI003D932467